MSKTVQPPSAFSRQTNEIVELFVSSSIKSSCNDRKLTNLSLEVVDNLAVLCDEFQQRFETTFLDETLQVLEKTPDNDDALVKTFSTILSRLFKDVNWGRIVGMFTLLRFIAKSLDAEQKNSLLSTLTSETSSYINNELGDYILGHGGWVSHTLNYN